MSDVKIAFGTGSAAPLAGCCSGLQGSDHRRQWPRYDYDRPNPSRGNNRAERYHRDNPRPHRERTMSTQERVYCDPNARHYCLRFDGTTGLVFGAVAGGGAGQAIEGRVIEGRVIERD